VYCGFWVWGIRKFDPPRTEISKLDGSTTENLGAATVRPLNESSDTAALAKWMLIILKERHVKSGRAQVGKELTRREKMESEARRSELKRRCLEMNDEELK
jgi:hypothetical protein